MGQENTVSVGALISKTNPMFHSTMSLKASQPHPGYVDLKDSAPISGDSTLKQLDPKVEVIIKAL